MSENMTEVSQETSPATSEKETNFEPITSQEQLNRIISDRVGRERKKFADYDELQSKAARFDELEEARKSELQRAMERAEKAEAKAREAELRIAITEIAAKHDVPAQLLSGDSADELEVSAKALAEWRSKMVAKVEPSKNQRGGFNPLLGMPPKPGKKDDMRVFAREFFDKN